MVLNARSCACGGRAALAPTRHQDQKSTHGHFQLPPLPLRAAMAPRAPWSEMPLNGRTDLTMRARSPPLPDLDKGEWGFQGLVRVTSSRFNREVKVWGPIHKAPRLGEATYATPPRWVMGRAGRVKESARVVV